VLIPNLSFRNKLVFLIKVLGFVVGFSLPATFEFPPMENRKLKLLNAEMMATAQRWANVYLLFESNSDYHSSLNIYH